MTLDTREFENLAMEAVDLFYSNLVFAYEEDYLEDYLDGHGMLTLLPRDYREAMRASYGQGKIVIIGKSKISPNIIRGLFKEYGVSPDRLELYLDYDKLTNLDLTSLHYSQGRYSLILLGPMPHSIRGKGDSTSFIDYLEERDGYPPVKRLRTAQGLKISRTSLRRVLDEVFVS